MFEKLIAPEEQQAVEEVKEFWAEDLGQTDSVFIKTQNASYRFKIIDPEHQRGTLLGGCLNNKPYRATLLGYRRKPATGAPEPLPALQVGVGAAFDVDLPEGKGQVMTSPVTQVVLVRVNEQSSPIAPRLPEATYALRQCATCGFAILLKFAEISSNDS